MKHCDTMTDVRAAIDAVDRDIVPLLLERLRYIERAGVIKQNRDTVHDDARIEDVVSKVRACAREHGGSADYVEDIYRYLIGWSIDHEFTVWDRVHDRDEQPDGQS